LTPFEFPRHVGWGSYHKQASLLYRKGRGQRPVLSNGAYSNRLDQAGLDSPPFDGVNAL
jgi:hypothetical protein